MSNIDIINSQFSSNKPYLFRALYQWILDNDGTPYLLVDATQLNVQVPREHVKNGQIVLNASPGAIQAWFVDNTAISFSARFSGKAQNIYIPMRSLLAVYAQENGLGMAFTEESGIEESGIEEPEIEQPEIKMPKDKLEEQDNAKPSKSKGSHLKVIK